VRFGQELELLTSREAVETLDSPTLYVLEQGGGVAREHLDRRVVEWTEQGWSQRKIAKEIDCTDAAVRQRQQRLGIKPTSKRGGRRDGAFEKATFSNSSSDPEPIVDAEVVSDETVPVDAGQQELPLPSARMSRSEMFRSAGLDQTDRQRQQAVARDPQIPARPVCPTCGRPM